MLRIGFLGSDSFWLDEAFSVSAVLQHSARDVWTTSLDPNHPSLYFVILWAALHLAGASETAARLPSALASICNLGLLFVLARRLGLTRTAAVSAVALLALSPVDIWYAQEARMYELVATTALVFAIGLTIDSWIGGAMVATALMAGLYVNFAMVPLSAALTSLWLVRWWRTGRRPIQLGRVAAASALAWWGFRPQWTHLGEVLRRIDTVPLLVRLRETLGLRLSPGLPAIGAVLLIAVGIGIAAAATWTALGNQRFRERWTWLVWAGFLVSTAALAVPRGYSAKQFLVTGWPFLVLVVAWTIVDDSFARTRPATVVSTGRLRVWLAVAVSLIAAIVTVATPRADWRGVVAYLNARASRTHAVWIDPSWNTSPYNYYRPAIGALINPIAAEQSGAQGKSAGGDRCLVAERFGKAPPTSPSEAWLDSHFKLVDTVNFARLQVRCYRN